MSASATRDDVEQRLCPHCHAALKPPLTAAQRCGSCRLVVGADRGLTLSEPRDCPTTRSVSRGHRPPVGPPAPAAMAWSS